MAQEQAKKTDNFETFRVKKQQPRQRLSAVTKLMNNVEVVSRKIEEQNLVDPSRTLPHETAKMKPNFDDQQRQDYRNNSKQNRTRRKTQNELFAFGSKEDINYSQGGKNRLSNCKSASRVENNNFEQKSIDSIGDAADISLGREDSPLCPASSVLKDGTLFKDSKFKLGENLWRENIDKKSKNDHESQRSDNAKKSKLQKTRSLKVLDKKPFKSYNCYPNYLGFYFREIYRNTVKELYENSRLSNSQLYFNNNKFEDPDQLPKMYQKMIDDNKTHVTQSMQGLYYCNTVKKTDGYKKLKYELPRTNKTKLAIFDMDETLIHWIPDRVRKCKKHTKSSPGPKCAIWKEMKDNETDVLLDFKCSDGMDYLPVNIRPYIIECLLQVKKWYQVIVFTASKKQYADTILDFIDPNRELIEARWYRDSCYTTEEHVYIKDLRIFEDQWDLKDIVLIDNAVHSFGFQVNNGIPMLPFYDYKNDRDMIHTTHFLQTLSYEYDVRPLIRDTFWIEKLRQNEIIEAIEGVIEYAIEEIEDTVLEELERGKQPKQADGQTRSRSAPRSSINQKTTAETTKPSSHAAKIDDYQVDFSIREENEPRPTLTDLEITDDTDEHDGDVKPELQIVAKSLRKMPWKPSNMNRMQKESVVKSKPQTKSK